METLDTASVCLLVSHNKGGLSRANASELENYLNTDHTPVHTSASYPAFPLTAGNNTMTKVPRLQHEVSPSVRRLAN